MSAQINPEKARELLARAEQLGASTRSGASWPVITAYLLMGALSSMLTVCMHLLGLAEARIVWLPLLLLAFWVTALIRFMAVFTRSTKLGFGRRHLQVMVAWGLLWMATMFGVTTFAKGQLWFTVLSAACLSVLTVWGAWREARL